MAAKFEKLATILDPILNQSSKETFHEYLKAHSQV